MENNNKSQAEIYREERKERLAKAAAKNAKKSPKAVKAKKIAGKVIAIVLAVVLIVGAVGGILNFFGTPEKVLKVSTGDKSYSFTLAEFNLYYFQTWSNYRQAAAQYDQYYGEGFGLSALGFDYQKPPKSQKYTEDSSSITGITVEEIGVENPTWADAFAYAAIAQLIQTKYGAEKAKEAEITLTEEQTSTIDKSIEDIRSDAKENDYSVDRYLRATYGNGVTEKLLRQFQTETYLQQAYFEKLSNDTLNAVTSEQINEKYNENPDNYNLTDVRLYKFTTDFTADENATDEEKAAAKETAFNATKAKADAFINSVADENSFIKNAETAIKQDNSSSNVNADTATKCDDYRYSDFKASSEDLAKWVYDGARKAGDKTVIDAGEGTYYVILVITAPHKDTSVNSHDVRHILVKFPTDDSGKTKELSDAEKKTYYDKAKAILDEYSKNPTEENFAALATSKSEDTGSAKDGGLIADIHKDSSYVEAFLNWSVSSDRKVGDTGIIETEYGYHVMFYSKGEGETWYETVKDEIATENYNAVIENLIETQVKTVKIDSVLINFAESKMNKRINNIIANRNSSN